MRPILLAGLVLSSCALEPAPASDAVASATVEGVVLDDRGQGIAGVGVTLADSRRPSGQVTTTSSGFGCGAVYPQRTVYTGADGRFRATLPFQPTTVWVSRQVEWYGLPSAPLRVVPGAPIVLQGRFIPHRTVDVRVVDEACQPIPEARVQPGGTGLWHLTGPDGRASFALADDGPPTLRVRRMGYRPAVVPSDAAGPVVLQPRPMVTVTVLDASTRQPIAGAVEVSLWQAGERLSFCTAGPTHLTHEAAVGACTLDAEPGAVELRLDGAPVQVLHVDGAMAVAVTAVLAQPPAPTDGY